MSNWKIDGYLQLSESPLGTQLMVQTTSLTILEAIGNELVLGSSERLGILAVQETDIPGSGNNSIGRVEAILESIYVGIGFDTSVTSLDGGGDATGFVLAQLRLNYLTPLN